MSAEIEVNVITLIGDQLSLVLHVKIMNKFLYLYHFYF